MKNAAQLPAWARILTVIGTPVIEHWETFRLALTLHRQILQQVLRGRVRIAEVLQSVIHMGIGSLPVVTVSTAFAGIVITGEIAWHMDRALHTITMIPGFAGQFTLREIGVAIPALIFVSKVGASTTAEVGTMRITEQIDALKLLGINPVDYLVVPRWVAGLISMVCLTFVAIAVTLGCSMALAVGKFGFSAQEYLNALRHFIGWKDLLAALVKSLVFGGLVPIIACAYGLRCRGGAEGVGTATTNAVVASTLMVIVADFILTFVFSFSL